MGDQLFILRLLQTEIKQRKVRGAAGLPAVSPLYPPLQLGRRDRLVVSQTKSQLRVADELHVTTAAGREAERVLDDVTVASHRRQLPVDVLLLAHGLVTLGEILDHTALLAIVSAKLEIRSVDAWTISLLYFTLSFVGEESCLHANLDAYPLLQILLIHDEQPLVLLVLRRLWIDHLFLHSERVFAINALYLLLDQSVYCYE